MPGIQWESSSQGSRRPYAKRIRQPVRGSPRTGCNLNPLKTNIAIGTKRLGPSNRRYTNYLTGTNYRAGHIPVCLTPAGTVFAEHSNTMHGNLKNRMDLLTGQRAVLFLQSTLQILPTAITHRKAELPAISSPHSRRRER